MDIVGPLRKTETSKRIVLLIMDYRARLREAIALKHIDSETTSTLWNISPGLEHPKRSSHEQGSNFVSRTVQGFYKMVGVKPICTLFNHPQTDGHIDSFNLTLKQLLKKMLNKDFANHGAKQDNIGYFQYQLIYGRMMRDPVKSITD